jgi:hypothetical protein
MEMNMPELMKICQKLAPMLKITPKETWDLMNIELSIQLDKPQIDVLRLDEILYRDEPDDSEKSSAELVLEKYGQETLDYIQTLI